MSLRTSFRLTRAFSAVPRRPPRSPQASQWTSRPLRPRRCALRIYVCVRGRHVRPDSHLVLD
eukprot:1722855-Pyramimonas_sp.AAC.1